MKKIVLFDMDGTLTPARKKMQWSMEKFGETNMINKINSMNRYNTIKYQGTTGNANKRSRNNLEYNKR